MTRDEYEQWVVALDDPVIRSWLWLHTKSIRDAEKRELVQEVRTRLLLVRTAYRDFKGESDARRYGYGVAANVGIDWLRKHTGTSGIHSDMDVQEIGDCRYDPEREAIAAQELRRLVEAIQELPRKCSRVVTLVKVYRHSIRETARILGIREDSVKAHLRRAREKCVEQLQKETTPETTHLLARLLNCIGLGNGQRPTKRRKLIDPTE